jgi:hypothetical protein
MMIGALFNRTTGMHGRGLQGFAQIIFYYHIPEFSKFHLLLVCLTSSLVPEIKKKTASYSSSVAKNGNLNSERWPYIE